MCYSLSLFSSRAVETRGGSKVLAQLPGFLSLCVWSISWEIPYWWLPSESQKSESTGRRAWRWKSRCTFSKYVAKVSGDRAVHHIRSRILSKIKQWLIDSSPQIPSTILLIGCSRAGVVVVSSASWFVERGSIPVDCCQVQHFVRLMMFRISVFRIMCVHLITINMSVCECVSIRSSLSL